MNITFELSESGAIDHGREPQVMTLEGSGWVQITGDVMISEDGTEIASLKDCGCWTTGGDDRWTDVIFS